MRKKRGRGNFRTTRRVFPFGKRKRTEDETDWFLLDAKTAPAQERRKRRGRSGRVVRMLAVACLAITVPLGLKLGYDSIFYENEEFVLQRLNVQSDGSLRSNQILEVANVAVGMSLMDLDLRAIRERIERLPVVEESIVSREMPDKLNVLVKERIPVAWISCPPLGVRPGDMERGYLVDRDGILFRCLDLTDAVSALPVIETFSMPDPVEGATLEADGLDSALRLIAAAENDEAPLTRSIHLVRLRNEWSLHAHYRSGLQVTFGAFDVERGLRDLAVIVDQVEEAGATLATVDVVAKENIPVTFVAPVDPDRFAKKDVSLQANAEKHDRSPFDSKEKHLRSILNGG